MTDSTKQVKLSRSGRWVPKTWNPMYDQWVALRVGGWGNARIGEQFGYSAQQVCNVLNTPQAKALFDILSRSIQSRLSGDTASRLAGLEEAAVNRIETVLTNEELAIKNPLAVADRALAFLKGVGKLGSDEKRDNNKTTNNFIIPVELATKLVDGMDKANDAMMKFGNAEVRKLPSGESKDA